MGKTKTSSAVKERFNSKTYRKFTLRFRRDDGLYEKTQDAATNTGESMNEYIVEAVRQRMDAKEKDRA